MTTHPTPDTLDEWKERTGVLGKELKGWLDAAAALHSADPVKTTVFLDQVVDEMLDNAKRMGDRALAAFAKALRCYVDAIDEEVAP